MLWRPPSRRVRVIRTAILAAAILAISGLAIKLPSNAGTIVVVVDRSKSMPSDIVASATESAGILMAHRPESSRLGIVSFAETSQVEKLPANQEFNGFLAKLSGDQSRLKSALEKALALIPAATPGRVLLLTDGGWTGTDPSSVFADATARGIAVDYRSFRRPSGGDLAISAVEAPHSVVAGEYFTIGIQINSTTTAKANYQILKNGRALTKGELKLHSGTNRFFFRDKGEKPDTFRYEFRITKNGGIDPRPENNNAKFLVRVEGKRPILLLTMNEESGLGKTLKNGGFNIRIATPDTVQFTLESLSAYGGIIIENVPADKIGDFGLLLLAELATRGGTGLMMTGGKNSYGLGGYYKSPLEPVLPVTMELRREHRKLSLSIVVALDRSGSMAMTVGSGETKMDLANISTLEVLNLLSKDDEFGVIAVDSAPHVVIPLSRVGDTGGMESRIRNIESMGGGIYVYEALLAATRMQVKAAAGTKHIILFADAADAEQPGKYKALLEKTTKAGITVSVIGLGLPTDSDAEFLRDVAARGKGRCLFSDNPRELPRLFAQDTFVIARNTFVDTPVSARFAGAVRSLSPLNFGSSTQLGGYNLCYIRPKAMLGAISEDEFKAPIIAFWRHGLGRVVCFAGEVDGQYTGAFADWPHAGDLIAAMVGWMSGLEDKGLPEGVMATQEVKNGVNHIRLRLDPDRFADPFKKIPNVTTLSGQPGGDPVSRSTKMSWETPDILICEIPMSSGEVYLSTLRCDSFAAVTLPPVRLPYPPEFKPQSTNSTGEAERIFNLCRGSGGTERINLANIWNDLPSRGRYYPLASWLLLAAIALLLLEVMERRGTTILKWPRGLFARFADKARSAKLARKSEKPLAVPEREINKERKEPRMKAVEKKTSDVVATKETSVPEEITTADTAETSSSLSDALRQARKNTRK
ncbi:MAG: VWA domain-containing protein [Victivallales bacterium]|nr:VWA domain-containing protein [Victivallales bacterium]